MPSQTEANNYRLQSQPLPTVAIPVGEFGFLAEYPDWRKISTIFDEKILEEISKKNTSGERVEQQLEQIKLILEQITLGDVICNLHEFITPRFGIKLVNEYKQLLIENCSDLNEMPFVEAARIIAEKRSSPDLSNRKLIECLETISFEYIVLRVIEKLFARTDAQSHVDALMFAFGVENPFIKIPPVVREASEILYNFQLTHSSPPLILNGLEKEKAFKTLSLLLNEVGFTAQANFAHAWSYCQYACRALMDLMSISNFNDFTRRKKAWLFKKILILCRDKEIVYPPQIFFIFEQIVSVKECESYEEYFSKLAKSLGEPLNGEPNYSVYGLNRASTNPETLKRVSQSAPNHKKAGIAVVAFSGPLMGARARLQQLENATGVNLLPMSIDVMDPDALTSRSKTVFINSEIIPNQNPSTIFADPNIKNTHDFPFHIKAEIPEDTDKIEKIVNFDLLRYWDDGRGSILYLPKDKLREYLSWLLDNIKPGTIVYFSVGISNWLIVDLSFEKQDDGSLEIVEHISYLSPVKNSSKPLPPHSSYNPLHRITESKRISIGDYITKFQMRHQSKNHTFSENFQVQKELRMLYQDFLFSVLNEKWKDDIQKRKEGRLLLFSKIIQEELIETYCNLLLQNKTIISNAFLAAVRRVISISLSNLSPDEKLSKGDFILHKINFDYHDAQIIDQVNDVINKLIKELNNKADNTSYLETTLIKLQFVVYVLEDFTREMLIKDLHKLAGKFNITTAEQGVLYPKIVAEAWEEWVEKWNIIKDKKIDNNRFTFYISSEPLTSSSVNLGSLAMYLASVFSANIHPITHEKLRMVFRLYKEKKKLLKKNKAHNYSLINDISGCEQIFIELIKKIFGEEIDLEWMTSNNIKVLQETIECHLTSRIKLNICPTNYDRPIVLAKLPSPLIINFELEELESPNIDKNIMAVDQIKNLIERFEQYINPLTLTIVKELISIFYYYYKYIGKESDEVKLCIKSFTILLAKLTGNNSITFHSLKTQTLIVNKFYVNPNFFEESKIRVNFPSEVFRLLGLNSRMCQAMIN